MAWISARREIYAQINLIFLSTSVALNIWVFTSFFLILKIVYMSLFGRFQFWAPTRFPEVICPRYDPEEICSSNPPVVTGICDPNKSRALHHRSTKIPFLLGFAIKVVCWHRHQTVKSYHNFWINNSTIQFFIVLFIFSLGMYEKKKLTL